MGKEEIERIAEQYSQDPVTLKLERVAAYVRVSSTEQKLHGLSLDAQKMKLIDYAKSNNMKIVEWYVDEGVSGRKLIKKRPELQRMMHDAQKRNFTRIITIKLDRFFRSVAEYHEFMKNITPVVWTTTEEKYDLTTASGRFFVNAKLAVAEMEADQTGERIDIVNEYKVRTGQPLSGSMPFGFAIAKDETTGKKKVVKDLEVSDAVEDVIKYYFMHQGKRKALLYLHTKYHIMISYKTLSLLLSNTMLCGEYRGNPAYCEAYMSKETFNKLQEIIKRNVKNNTKEDRTYIFSGLILCPHCNTKLKAYVQYKRNVGGMGKYKKYRCSKSKLNNQCDFKKVVNETTLEKLMLANIEKYLAEAKIRSTQITDDSGAVKIPKFDIEAIHEEIDRLNYSWQTGKIRKVEQYEKQYAELLEKLEEAEAEQGEVAIKDFSRIETILHSGWKEIYNSLDDEHKRAFWRSFVKSIEINWTTEKKEITRVNFF